LILDAYAVLALLKGEPAAEAVRRLVSSEPRPVLTAIGVAEVIDHLVRIEGASEEAAALDLAQLGLSDPAPVDAMLATAAGSLRARQYHRTNRAVSLADCVAAEAARAAGSALVTADPHLLDLCLEEGINAVILPDSAGRTWSSN
jgi:PIN domain nuclease of toxin-antitoxin system